MKIVVNVNATVNLVSPAVEAAMAAIPLMQADISKLTKEVAKMDASLDDVLADVQAETTAIGGVSTFIQGLQSQLQSVLSGATLPPGVQQKVNAIFAAAESNKAALAAAITTTPSGDQTPPVDTTGTGDGSTGTGTGDGSGSTGDSGTGSGDGSTGTGTGDGSTGTGS